MTYSRNGPRPPCDPFLWGRRIRWPYFLLNLQRVGKCDVRRVPSRGHSNAGKGSIGIRRALRHALRES